MYLPGLEFHSKPAAPLTEVNGMTLAVSCSRFAPFASPAREHLATPHTYLHHTAALTVCHPVWQCHTHTLAQSNRGMSACVWQLQIYICIKKQLCYQGALLQLRSW